MDIIEKIQKGQVKGYLTTRKRIIFEEGIYHITQRAPGREVLFLEKPDYLYFLKLLKQSVKKFNLELFCFALLPNHLHLLLKINEKNLSQAMKNLFERYAVYLNKKYQRKGHAFCGRYRASLCNDESYLLAASIYIHLNPRNAGLCADFREYRWSSILLYAGEPKETFVNFTQILSILSSQDDKARQIYLGMLENASRIKKGGITQHSLVGRVIKDLAMVTKGILGKNKDSEGLTKKIEVFKEKGEAENRKERERAKKYLVGQLRANGYTAQEIMETLSIGKATYYRTIRPK